MTIHNIRIIFFLSVFQFLSIISISFAQAPSSKDAAKSPGFRLFFEKAYLHTDRSIYSSGEYIWFKAYLVNGQSNYATATSGHLYVELISPASIVVKREVIHLDKGIGAGDFQLSDSIEGGTYRIRAYTGWMMNFEDNFVFEKEIQVVNAIGVPNTLSKAKLGKNVVQFFPEGGSLIEGVMSIVAFKATDAKGNSCKAKGVILSSKGDTITQFASTHLGMGSFAFLPIQGEKYYAKGILKDKEPFTSTIPEALTKGFVIKVVDKDTASLMLVISTNIETYNEYQGKELTLIARARGKNCFTGPVSLNAMQTAVKVSKKNFPGGVASLTIYDNAKRPHCERLVYIHKPDNIKFSLTSDKATYKPREKVVVKIKAATQGNVPVKANLSLAVVDAGVVGEEANNIAAYLMLTSEIKGKIEEPKIYFDSTNTNRFKQLDNLLLVQGWRDFVWRKLADASITLKYMPEPGITVSGYVRKVFVNKPVDNANITLRINGAVGSKLFSTNTDSLGKYYLDGIEFYGLQTLSLTSRDNKGKKEGWILLDSLFKNKLQVTPRNVFSIDTAAEVIRFKASSQVRRSVMKQYSISDTVKLDEFLVKARRKPVVLRNQTLTSAGYPEYSFNVSPKDYDYTDLAAYILHKVPGATSTNDSNRSVTFIYNGQPMKAKFLINGKEDLYGQNNYYSLSMDQIKRVNIAHLISLTPSTDALDSMNNDTPMGTYDVFLIELDVKPGALDQKDFSIVNTEFEGYYMAQVFYSPQYDTPSQDNKRDIRTTVYWQPNIVTDENGEATVTFFNPDQATKMRIVAEGLTKNGVPLAGAKGYIVKK